MSKQNSTEHRGSRQPESNPNLDSITLYSYFRSSTSYRVRIALNLKGLSYTQKNIHLLEGGGQQHTSEYRSVNPAGEVPSLVHQGRVLSQSLPIMEYLDEIATQPQLFCGSAFDRAKIRQIAEHINSGIHPLANLKVQQYLTQSIKVSDEQKTQWIQHWLREGMNSLEALVKPTAGIFAYGDTVTAADVCIIPQIFSSQRFGVPVEDYPTLQRIQSQCLPLEAFKKAHPHLQPDTPKELQGVL